MGKFIKEFQKLGWPTVQIFFVSEPTWLKRFDKMVAYNNSNRTAFVKNLMSKALEDWEEKNG